MAGSPEAQLLSCLSKYPSSRQILSTGVACLIRRQGDERNERRFSGGKESLMARKVAASRETRQDGTVFVSLPGRTGCCLLPSDFRKQEFPCRFSALRRFFRNGKRAWQGRMLSLCGSLQGFPYIFRRILPPSMGVMSLNAGLMGCSTYSVFPVSAFSCESVFQRNAASVVVFHDGSRFGDGRGGRRRIITREPSGMRGSMDFPSTRTTYSFLPRGLSM